ncbi:hypothetical protein p1B140 (plasmid) [Aromatoleum aromaticum EbN1]|uniref:Uncharacterized protein n=1 Tax=Aromatoleum aromaticum (strain DSM 19018 / LMG 30748 / EbN1) TaxID=76114 RepID=Q5NX68_AROAE|nr:hypothetical protein p1B140 [Aromatoleum aromaticum EbN1]
MVSDSRKASPFSRKPGSVGPETGFFFCQQDVSLFWSLHRDLQSINVRNPARGRGCVIVSRTLEAG